MMTKSKSKTEKLNVEVMNLETDDNNIEVIGKNQSNSSIVMYLDRNCEDKYFVKFIKAFLLFFNKFKLFLSILFFIPDDFRVE